MNILRYALSISAILFATGISLKAQTEPPFGSFSQQDISMKECSFDKEAEAVVLLDIAKAYPVDYSLITERRVRLKILKESAIDRGNVIIYFYADNDFENISLIEGLVHNTDANGYPTTISLEKSSIYRQKINERWSELKLAMPQVKVGSIIEYRYQSTMKSWSGLDKWEFQQDIPTVFSRYDLTILPSAEFAYSVVHRSDLPVTVKSIKDEGRIIFEMKDVAGLRAEPFSDAPMEYQQRVIFQLSKFQNGSGSSQKYSDSWFQLAKDLLNESNFGRAINKSISGTSVFLSEVKALPTEFQKMEKIYSYVRKNFGGDGYRSIYASDGLNKVWDKKVGNTGERNLLLINLLKEAKLDAAPLLVCDRMDGKVSKAYPFRDQFKKVVALVEIEGKKYVLDATDKHTPIEMIPFSLVNTLGFAVVWKNTAEPFLLEAPNKLRRTTTFIQSSLDQDGVLSGQVLARSSDYDRVARVENWQEANEKNFLARYFLDEVSDVEVDSFSLVGLDNDSVALQQKFKFKTQAPLSGDYRLVTLNLFTQLKNSPFVSSIRFTNINFGTPVSKTITLILTLNDKMSPEELPKNISLVMPDKSLSFQRLMVYEKTRNEIQMRVIFEIAKPVFTPEEYPSVSEFYKKMVGFMNEPLVLKQK